MCHMKEKVVDFVNLPLQQKYKPKLNNYSEIVERST